MGEVGDIVNCFEETFGGSVAEFFLDVSNLAQGKIGFCRHGHIKHGLHTVCIGGIVGGIPHHFQRFGPLEGGPCVFGDNPEAGSRGGFDVDHAQYTVHL